MNAEGFVYFFWRTRRFPGWHDGHCTACEAQWRELGLFRK